MLLLLLLSVEGVDIVDIQRGNPFFTKMYILQCLFGEREYSFCVTSKKNALRFLLCLQRTLRRIYPLVESPCLVGTAESTAGNG